MVAGGPGGFAALGRGPGGYMAAFLSADGLSWRSGISFGPAPASVTGATVTAAGTVLVTGARGAAGSQRPYLALAQPGQSARAVNVSAVPGAKVSQLSLNAVAVYRNQRVAVGEAGGLPAVWSAAGGSWSPVSWSSSPGNGASTPSGSGPSASASSPLLRPARRRRVRRRRVPRRPARRRPVPACLRLVDVRLVRVRFVDNSSVRLTCVRRVRDRLCLIRHVGGRSVVWLRVWLTLARRSGPAQPRLPRPGLVHPRPPRPTAQPRLPRPGLAQPRPPRPGPAHPRPRFRLRRTLCPFRHLRRPRRQRRRQTVGG